MRLLINDVEMDIIESDIIARYAISKLFDFTAPAASRTQEFDLPRTANNLSALGNPHVVMNDDTDVFDLLDAQLYVDGVDMLIEKAQVISVTNTIKVRLFGSSIAFFNAIADKYLDELDLTALDHTWDFTTVTAALQATTGYIYPIIDYSDILDSGTDVNAEALFPAIYAKDIFEQIITDAGYTVAGDLTTDADFATEIIPFSNKEAKGFDSDEFDSLGFIASKQSGNQVFTVGAGEAQLTLDTVDSGTGFASNEYTIAYNGHYRFSGTLYGRTATSADTWQVNLYRKPSASPEVLMDSTSVSFVHTSDSYIGYNFDDFYFEATDTVYIKLKPIPAVTTRDLTIKTGYIGTGLGYTRFYLKEAVNTVSFGEPWRVALNLPRIKQTDFIKQYVRDYGCLVTTDEQSKTVTFTKITTILAATAQDWSDKIDESAQEITYSEQQLAQANRMEYLEDENVTKTRGVDYSYMVTSTALPGEQDFIKAIFGATQTGAYLDYGMRIPIIERSGSNVAKPRRLVSLNTSEYEVRIYSDSEGVDGSYTAINVPYFIDATRDFDLRYITFAGGKTADMLSTLTNMRTLTVPVRLSPADVNQLDLLRPVYIEKYGVNFLILDIQYNYRTRKATAKLLVI